jgi:hypothetical protein
MCPPLSAERGRAIGTRSGALAERLSGDGRADRHRPGGARKDAERTEQLLALLG